MGGSKKVTTGYRYFLGLHMAICYGPVDRLKRILVGDRLAWPTGCGAQQQATESGTIFIDSRNLFGGDAREGGIMGHADVLMGEATQGPNAYLQSQLGSQVPSYRGVLSLVLKGPGAGVHYVLKPGGIIPQYKAWSEGYVGSNNPYLKPWALQVERITKGWQCDAVWYPEKAAILMSGSPDIETEHVSSTGTWQYKVINPPPTYPIIPSELTPPVSGYSAGAAPFGTAATFTPDIPVATEWEPQTALWLRTTVTIPADLECCSMTIAGLIENGVAVYWDGVFVGGYNQTGATDVGGLPAFSVSIPKDALTPGDHTLALFCMDEDAHTPGADNTYVYATATGLYPGYPFYAMNPAHIVYQCVTDSNWGMGYPAAAIDTASFAAVADVLYDEGFGLCMIWNQQTTIQEFIGLVMDHIGGIFYADPTTGKFKLKLIRNDYDAGTLEVFDESNIVALESFQRVGYGETVNEVTVVYRDQDLNRDTSITVQDLANVSAQGGVVSKTVQYPGIPIASLAGRVAERDLIALSTPLAKARISVNRAAWSKIPGDVVKLSWPKLGLSSVVMRVLAINTGTLTDGTITVELAEDVFGLPDSTYAAQEPGAWTEPNVLASPILIQAVLEAPYWTIARTFEPSDFDQVDADAGYVRTLAARSQAVWQGYRIWSRVGAADFEERNTGAFSASATLLAAIDRQDATITIQNGIDLDLIEIGKLLVLGSGQAAEWVEVTAVDLGTSTLDIARGVLDTTPADWAMGTRIWLADEYLGEDQTERATTEVVDVRLATIATGGELDVDDATTMPITMAQRFARPYPPGNIAINGSAWPTTISTALSVTWAHRDRTQQTAYVVHQDEADIGPEDGTTYNGYVYNDDTNDLVISQVGIEGTAWSPEFSGAFNARLELESERDGLVSWQRQVRRFAYNHSVASADVRLLEDGSFRLLEDGGLRLLETSAAYQDHEGYFPILYDGSELVAKVKVSLEGGVQEVWVTHSVDSGSTWVVEQNDIGFDPTAGAYGGGLYVTIGASGWVGVAATVGGAWTSSHITSYPEANVGGGVSMIGLIYDGTDFVAAGSYGIIITSSDGVTWTEVAGNELQTGGLGSGSFRSLAYASGSPGSYYGLFIANGGSPERLYESADLQSWTLLYENINSDRSLRAVRVLNGKLLLMGWKTVAFKTRPWVLESSDGGSTWNDVSPVPSSGNPFSMYVTDMAYFNARYVLQGVNLEGYSADLATWTLTEPASPQALSYPVHDATALLATRVLTTSSPSQVDLRRTTDGATWTTVPT